MIAPSYAGRTCAALATAFFVGETGEALAHGFAGDRFFPATIVIDDPFVADELSLPTVSRFNAGGDPAVIQTDISGELSKRITSNFGISFGEGWTRLNQIGPPRNPTGWQNLEITPKYQFLLNPPHEAVASLGLSAEIGGTGAKGIGAEPVPTLTPTLYFGKGFGDLPQSLNWARPLAVTGTVGYGMTTAKKSLTRSIDPDTGDFNADIDHHSNAWNFGLAVEYSNFYLRANVHDFGLPEWVNRLTPLVEFNFNVPVTDRYGEKTTGTISPGIIWSGQKVQFGIEALIPTTQATGRNIGFIAQLHFYLDDIFPHTVGRPIFGN
jgi:hypothetical protein